MNDDTAIAPDTSTSGEPGQQAEAARTSRCETQEESRAQGRAPRRPRPKSIEAAHRAIHFRRCLAAGDGFHTRLRAEIGDPQPRRQLPASRISRRSRVRADCLGHALSRVSEAPMRANSPSVLRIWCAREACADVAQIARVWIEAIKLGSGGRGSKRALTQIRARRYLRSRDRRDFSRRRPYKASVEFVERNWTGADAQTAFVRLRDPKTVLQEWAQGKGLADADLSRDRAQRTASRSAVSCCRRICQD